MRRFPLLHHLRRLDPRRIPLTLRDLWAIGTEIRRRRREAGLKIAIDGNSLFEAPTGVGWYLANVLQGLAEEAARRELEGGPRLVLRIYGPELIGGPSAPEAMMQLPSNVEHVIHRLDPRSMVPNVLVQKLSRPFWPWLVALDRNDLVFAPNFLIRRDFQRIAKPLVVTVHDLASRLHPGTLQRETLANLDRGLEQAMQRAVTIVVPSEAVRAEVLEATGRQPESVLAIHHGPGHVPAADEIPQRPDWAPPRYALMVGTIEPRKNLGVVLEAWRLMRDRNPETPPLVIVGKVGWKAESILPQLDQAVAAGLVIRPGYLRLAELLGLYQGSEVVVFPSVYEGFGLPVVEAFQAGKPLLASDIPVLREVADDAAMFAPPHDPEAWARALRELFDNPSRRNDLVARGTRRLADFDWRRSALTHLEVLEAAARS